MQDYIININGLYKSFKGVDVLKGINLKIRKGSVFCLLGSNGAGKTTTVKILSTLLQADKGKINICGFDLKKDPQKVRESISMTGQYAAVDELLTGRENMYLIGQLLHIAGYKERAEILFKQFELSGAANRRSGTYSGGMRRKLDIAMSLMGNPQILFLDEPTTGLDPQNRIAMWQEVIKLKQMGITIFLTTQYLEEAERLADHVAILNNGIITAEGSVGQLKNLLPIGAVQLMFDEKQYGPAQSILEAESAASNDAGLSLTVMTDGSVEALTTLLVKFRDAGIRVKSVVQKQPTLEDVFLSQIYSGKED
ncbi:ATP-binding cassette domain-containing protein [Anaerocolumna sedimenticola]|uniref:ATP-binding cassette domain-containing protein n=1 Tax=Anaerocolumna sedimenticola TaxID=2696063 RepID=A0A6P1TLC5_9FIRM|nr:ATP-binding cassette domain-containing protein [Anaerocolumna sedimenticola]QHQ61087.1 ATP-binding cassette domain-containing protein [Anaerocolumna sedimenticola]